MEKQYKRLSVEFPAEEYVFLRMACAKKGVSLKHFVTEAVLMKIDEYEAELDAKAYKEITDEERATATPWEQVKKELGWDKL